MSGGAEQLDVAAAAVASRLIAKDLPALLGIAGTVHTGMTRSRSPRCEHVFDDLSDRDARRPAGAPSFEAVRRRNRRNAPHIGLFATPAVTDRAIARAGALTSKDGAARG